MRGPQWKQSLAKSRVLLWAGLLIGGAKSKAKEMVMLAEKMRLKLLSGSTGQAGAANDEEMGSKQEMQDWLLSIGIASPVTKESAGALNHQQLSRQLADFVKLPLEKNGGMIALTEIYCLFNRARGTELICQRIYYDCAVWEKFDVYEHHNLISFSAYFLNPKYHYSRNLFEDNSLKRAVHEVYDHLFPDCPGKDTFGSEVFARIKALALKPDALRAGVSPSDAAMRLGIAPALAKEHLLTAESQGLLCRDISPEGFRFYINLFTEINPNNIYAVKDHVLFSSWVSAVSAIG